MRHAAQTPLVQGAFAGVAGLVLTLALVGCGGSGNGTAPETSGSPTVPPTVTPAATLPAHTGLVGAIDSARRSAVCENVRLYATAVDGGLSDAADQAFHAILRTLRQPPRDPALLAFAARWQLARAHVGDDNIAQRLTAFCAQN